MLTDETASASVFNAISIKTGFKWKLKSEDREWVSVVTQ